MKTALALFVLLSFEIFLAESWDKMDQTAQNRKGFDFEGVCN
jgi:hypothetical protein